MSNDLSKRLSMVPDIQALAWTAAKEIERLTAVCDDLLEDNRRNQELFATLTAERDAALDLVRWAYGKLNILVFSRMDDALKLDEMKLLLMQESSDE